MSDRSNGQSAVGKRKAIDAPFDAELLRQAEELAPKYRIIVKDEPEYGGCSGTVLEMPNVFAFAKTPNQCISKTRQMLGTAIAFLLEQGQRPPAPATENKRTEQVNVRLTADERYQIEEAARQEGFRGLSDFVRTTTLDAVRGKGPAIHPERRLKKKSARRA